MPYSEKPNFDNCKNKCRCSKDKNLREATAFIFFLVSILLRYSELTHFFQ